MKVNLYCVEDIKAGRFNPPFVAQTSVDACRAFEKNCLNSESLWNKYPEDFRLVCVGTFDDENPIASEWKHPGFIASAMNYVTKTVSKQDLLNAAAATPAD